MSRAHFFHEKIPELAIAQRVAVVDERTQVAFDALVLEKTMVDQLVVTWLDALRPEMERMAEQLARQSAQRHWREQAQNLNKPE